MIMTLRPVAERARPMARRTAGPETRYRLRVASPLGTLCVCSDGTHVTALHLDGDSTAFAGDVAGPAPAVLEAARDQLDAYFAGSLRSFDLPLATHGTPFQEAVWAGLRALRFGEVVSYGALAARIGRPGAQRAVGLANNRNPIAIIIPCHRVIGANGQLVGYGGGIDKKAWLLAHEGALGKR